MILSFLSYTFLNDYILYYIIFSFYRGLGQKSSSDQGLLLGLCPEITPGSFRKSYGIAQIVRSAVGNANAQSCVLLL